ncbi:MAG: FtsX-like permease family protein [Bacteroidales bacterium]|nr:FtsX-like permease family protein [Bacteroidales bacterium]
MKLILILAWRNIWRNRRRTLITISSVLFAVLLAIIFYSMEKGAYDRMIDTMVRYSTGYLQIQDVLYEEEPSIDHSVHFDHEMKALLQSLDDQIDFYVPRLQNFALVATENISRVAMVTGIDPVLENKLSGLSEDMVAGNYLTDNDEGILIAEGLAAILRVTIGDTLVLLGQGFHGATAAGMFPVSGIIDLKLPELNNNTIYMSLKQAQWFYMADEQLTSIIIMPENPAQTNALAAAIAEQLDPEWQRVLTWEELLADLLKLMQFDMAGTFLLMFILYVVIAFGLFGTIITMMIERQKEFALLFALGMKRGKLATMCLFESLMISIAGVIAGIGAAIPVVTYFVYNPIRLTGSMAEVIQDYGFEPLLPFSSSPEIFYSQALIVLLLALIIGLYPVYKAYRLDIIK